mgnify:CR=1 FL=1
MAKEKSKKPWHKRWWAIVLYIFIGLIILGNLFGQKDISSIDNSQEQAAPKIRETNTTSSKDFCRAIIPERIKLECCQGPIADHCRGTGRKNCVPGENSNFRKWTDGTPIKGSIWFVEGWETGQNINYLYSSQYLGYEKTPIDTDGTVGEEISYKLMIVLDHNDRSDAGFKVKSYKCCQFVCDIQSTSYKNW